MPYTPDFLPNSLSLPSFHDKLLACRLGLHSVFLMKSTASHLPPQPVSIIKAISFQLHSRLPVATCGNDNTFTNFITTTHLSFHEDSLHTLPKVTFASIPLPYNLCQNITIRESAPAWNQNPESNLYERKQLWGSCCCLSKTAPILINLRN